MENPWAFVASLPSVGKKRVRGIHEGNCVGMLYMLVSTDDERYVEVRQVMTDSVKGGDDWEYVELRGRVEVDENVSDDKRWWLMQMLWDRRGALSRGEEDFWGSKLPEFKIVLEDDTPIYQRPRHFSPPITQEIEEQCEELDRVGVIERSESAWNSPIVPVRKPDGSLWMCVDYRRVDEVTVKERFPMNVVSDCLYKMHGMRVLPN
ncbi:uncharacterized protein LOC135213874 [Macrobrachium nipponense]|uniref:uncharacterized protein LOC135213874 n=1 Tax=Macrobrachium nipponense TaxID=159736 RepID=UPI0030C8321F